MAGVHGKLGAGPAHVSLGHALLAPRGLTTLSLERLSVCPQSPGHCPASSPSQSPASCRLPPMWLHVLWVLPADPAPVDTYSALGTPCPCQAQIWAPRECCPLGCSSKASAFQPDGGGRYPRLQHPAWLVSPARCSSCVLPVVLLAVGLLGGKGGIPFLLASPLSITSAYSRIPLGSGKGGLFINFFPGEIIPPLVTWIAACSSSGGLTSFPRPIPGPLKLKRGQLCFFKRALTSGRSCEESGAWVPRSPSWTV